MNLNIFNIFKNSKLIKPSLYLGASLIVFLFIGIFGTSKTISQHKALTQAKSENQNLEEKLSLLETLSVGLSNDTDPVSNALMDTNPTPVVVSQLRRLALEHGLIIGNFKSNARLEDKDLQMALAVIDFKIDGTLPSILEFLKAIENTAPISTFTKVNIFSDTNLKSGGITLSTYWADYPTSLPPVDSGANELTKAEEELLIKLISLRQPLTGSVNPQPSRPRSDPFLQL